EPQSFESSIYRNWEAKGYFTPSIDPDKAPYSIVIPPPNITGQLHMGHALNNTVQDIIIRHKRMQGFSTLWLPGTDHASIATEVKIVEQLHKEGLDKETIGRDEFLKRAYAWKEKYGGRIVEQLKCLGSSCDWTREAFTMDERCSHAVREVFVNLYRQGKIYRGSRIINWCPDCKTALSDAEVEYEEKNSFLWHIRYPYEDGSGYLVVATTRPETMLGDTAVAVNPEDDRYQDKIGKKLRLPLTDRLIPVIADNYVEIGFGSGAVKITPAHDPNDFEVGLRHNLEVIRVMDDDGVMNDNAFAYNGLDRDAARKKVVQDLEAQGFIEKIEPYTHNVGECYRCHNVVEPIVSKQWFVKMEKLAKPAIKAVRNKKVAFIPDRFSKTYFNWMENVKDWCISRQLWWGHRIPAWYCEDCNEIIVEKEDPKICPKCGSTRLKQDEDVLDTWFSSALWPFSTLGYPEMTEDLKYFYPTNLLVTAYDIIFFWVARMIFSGIAYMGEIPFPEVLIHGIVRDAQGRKMSKSLGNGIDPLELIDKYGADVLRFSLCTGVAPGSDIRFSEDKMEPSRNFLNKIWNASKYVLSNCEGRKLPEFGTFKLNYSDKWILYKLNKTVSEVNANLKKYELGLAASKMYDFVWSDFCDWYIELTKPMLYGTDEKKKDETLCVLMYVLKNILKLMHPFTPFMTERIWQEIGESETIMLEKYPTPCKKLAFTKDYQRFENIKDIIRSVRNIRAETGALPSKKLTLYIVSSEKAYVKRCSVYIAKLANVGEIRLIDSAADVKEKVSNAVLEHSEVLVPLGELIDFEKEIARLTKDLNHAKAEVDRCERMLSNPGFLNKAPKQLIEKETANLATSKELCAKLEARINELNQNE
ncbi:MAG: valine--tRNA ligase, partial [Clostridia bacterium]|nr:valine--tRNA ligase [Clostridia bacterium]